MASSNKENLDFETSSEDCMSSDQYLVEDSAEDTKQIKLIETESNLLSCH